MVKAQVDAVAAGPGIYSATYSGIPVYEYQFGLDLKEHVMRRRQDDWINATHILKAAGFDKPARTRILEREVQKDTHEKIQGGYGKYQGTWIPLEAGVALAQRNNVYDRLRPIFEFRPGADSPPPAPRHTSKPKQPKKPAVPKFKAARPAAKAASQPIQYQPSLPPDGYAPSDIMIEEDETPDNVTVASASYMAEDDSHDMLHLTGHRKRKREELAEQLMEQEHRVYGDELLDYFLLSRNQSAPCIRPEPPANFRADHIIDTEHHTALHWASSMGDVDVVRQMLHFKANADTRNVRGETPLIRAVNFTNCYDKQTFPIILKELFHTIDVLDNTGCTALHHAIMLRSGRVTNHSCSRYYIDNILNRLQETQHDPNFVQQLVDAQDNNGNTALHLAAQAGNTKCIRALIGRSANPHIANNEGVRAEDLIKEINATKMARSAQQRSSSPFAPESAPRSVSLRDALPGLGDLAPGSKRNPVFKSEAASTVQKRITPLVFEKFHDLARNYEDEWIEKDTAEREAQRILANTQSDLANVRARLALADAELLADDGGDRLEDDVRSAASLVTALVSTQNRIAVEGHVEGVLDSGGSINGDGPDDKVALANELRFLLGEQQMAETQYVDALSVVGTGDRIDRYRRLLKTCLGPEADSLDDNLDGIIAMMEEDASDGAVMEGVGAAANGLAEPEPMDVGL